MYVRNDVSLVRRSITSFVGSKVKLESNKGRQKAVVSHGTIENAYPSIFTVSLDYGTESKRTVSYSYTDILTKTIEITVFE